MTLTGPRRTQALVRVRPGWRSRLLRRAALVSLLIHLVIGALLLLRLHPEGEQEMLPPPAPVSMLFESGRRQGPTLPQPNPQTTPSVPAPPTPATPPTPEAPPLPPEVPPEAQQLPTPAPQSPLPVPPVTPPMPQSVAPQTPEVPPPATPAPVPLLQPAPLNPPAPASPSLPVPMPPPAPEAPSAAELPPPAQEARPPPTATSPVAAPQQAVPPQESRPQMAAKPPPQKPAPAKPPAFPAPMDFSLGKPFSSPAQTAARQAARPRSTPHIPGTIDMSLGPAARGSADITPLSPHDQEAAGADWRNELSRWVAEHAYYPEQARREADEGDARVRVVAEPNGRVKEVELIGRSGSVWLDMALVALFRDQQIPPLPHGESEPIEFNFTMHYVILRR